MGRTIAAFAGAFVLLLSASLLTTNPFAGTARAQISKGVEGAIGTTLVRLRWHASDVAAYGFENAGSGTAIAALDDRVLIAEPSGRFFEARIGAADANLRLLPLRLDTNYAAIRAYSLELNKGVEDGIHRDRFVGVTGLAFLDGGKLLAAAYSYWDDEQRCVTVRVSLTPFRFNATDFNGDWREIYRSAPCIPVNKETAFFGQQAGGRLAKREPGTLLLTLGDFGHDGVQNPEAFSQDPAASYGKVVEIDVASGSHRMVAMGLRNPQGLAVDAAGRIWSTEHGPKGGDELNLIREGKDYGWPQVTLGTDYGSYVWPPSSAQGRHEGFEPPAFAWMPSSAPSNLIAVRDFIPEWEGDLLVAFLLGSRLGRIRLEGDRVVYEERIEIGERVRDIAQLGDGRIVLWTDSARLVLLAPDPTESVVARMLDTMPADLRAVVKECAQCHDLDVASGARIGLWGVYSRRVAAGDPALFSPALRERGGFWLADTLDAYLENPARAVPGTTMQHQGISDPGLRQAVIDFLKQLN